MQTLSDLSKHPRFEELKKRAADVGSDAVHVFGGTHTGGYYIQQNPDEFSALLCLLLERCRPIGVYGEIGVAAGGTTRLIYENVGFENAFLIDDGNHPKHRFFRENIDAFKLRTWVGIGDSHGKEIAEQLHTCMTAYHPTFFDVVFIDGDHSYEGVKQDIALVKPYCHPTTILIFHDTVCCAGVKRAFAELKHPVAEFVSEEKPLGIGVALHG